MSTPVNQSDDAVPAVRTPGPRPRRRRIIGSAAVLAVVGLLLANAAAVNGQSAGATGTSVLHLDGGDLSVSQDGPPDAPPLVLLHGLGASSNWWSSVVPILSSSHRVIRIDLLGHGRSAKPTGGGYTIPEQARRVGQALDRLGVRTAVVIGHSTGGYVATALAEERPELVTALALVDTGPRLDAFISDGPVGSLVFTPVLGQLLWRLRTGGLVRRSLTTAFAPGFEIPQQLVDDAGSLTYHALTAASDGSEDYLRGRSVPDRLQHLGKRLMVIFGEQDQRWRPSSAALYDVVPGARVEMVPGVGHSPMLENPRRTAALLTGFAGSA